MNKIILAGAAFVILAGAGCSQYKTPYEKPINNSVVQSESEEKKDIVEETIDISARGLTKIPGGIFDHINAVSLNLSKNRLSGAIPAEIRKMTRLRMLNMSGNKLTGIPAEVGQLTELEVLDVSNNQITGLPQEIGNLKNLKVLVLSGNEYSKTDLDQIMEQIPDVKIVD